MHCFVLSAALGNVLLFHGPLLRFSSSNLDPLSSGGTLILTTLFVLVFTTTAIVLAAAAVVHPALPKLLTMLIVIGNALALYFIHTYRIVLDKTMMGNVFNTSAEEATALFHPQLIGYALVFGVLPLILISLVKVTASSILARLTLLIALVLAGSSWIYANGRTWLWFDQHLQTVGALIMPWSYVVNAVRYQHQIRPLAASPLTLPDAYQIHRDNPVVVLVIGEAARAANFSMYGYDRRTNPALLRNNAVALPNSTACATYTTAAIACMLGHNGMTANNTVDYENLPTYLQRNKVVVSWRSNNTGHPEMEIQRFLKAGELRKSCVGSGCDYDQVLLTGLKATLQRNESRPRLIVLHQSGSHGPAYWTKYPPGFDQFNPVCRSVDLQSCSRSELINTYDNTIYFTDYLLGLLISTLQVLPDIPSVVIYISDHGESLGEAGLYLHGTPMAFAPDVQKNIPFVVWMSETFQRQRAITNSDLLRAASYSHHNIFHSVMGALGLRSDIYQPSLDIFSKGGH